MNNDLVMYYPNDLDIIFVPTKREYVMDFLDTVSLNKILQLQEEMIDKAEAGLYDCI